MITVTEEAEALIDAQEIPEGTVLRLDQVDAASDAEQVSIGFAPGEPEEDD